MVWVLIGALCVIAFAAGVVTTAYFAAKQLRRENVKLMQATESANGYALLKARIRAIQDNGMAINKYEMKYVIQKPNGKFGKFNLPKV